MTPLDQRTQSPTQTTIQSSTQSISSLKAPSARPNTSTPAPRVAAIINSLHAAKEAPETPGIIRKIIVTAMEARNAGLFAEYIRDNRESMRLWRNLFLNSRHLSRGTSLNQSGILRLYGNRQLFEMSANFHRNHGVLLEELSGDTLASRFPTLDEGVKNGSIFGAIVVEGYTFRAQKLVSNILNELESLNSNLSFEVEVDKINKNKRGEVESLRLSNGDNHSAENYALDLGAYDKHALLEDIGCEEPVAGVAGGWLILPKPPGPFLPLKVHDGQHLVNGRLMPVVDLNINVSNLDDGREVLIVGGGYLFVGKFPFTIPTAAKDLMLSEIHRVTELVLGDFYRSALKNGEILWSDRICVRSFTPSDRELELNLSTVDGGRFIAGGGGNTGTTAKAALTAERFVNLLVKAQTIEFASNA